MLNAAGETSIYESAQVAKDYLQSIMEIKPKISNSTVPAKGNPFNVHQSIIRSVVNINKVVLHYP